MTTRVLASLVSRVSCTGVPILTASLLYFLDMRWKLTVKPLSDKSRIGTIVAKLLGISPEKGKSYAIRKARYINWSITACP